MRVEARSVVVNLVKKNVIRVIRRNGDVELPARRLAAPGSSCVAQHGFAKCRSELGLHNDMDGYCVHSPLLLLLLLALQVRVFNDLRELGYLALHQLPELL